MERIPVAVIIPSKISGNTGDVSNFTELTKQLFHEGFEVTLICPKDDDKTFSKARSDLDIITIENIPFVTPPRINTHLKRSKLVTLSQLSIFLIIELVFVCKIVLSKNIKHVFIRHSILTMQLSYILRIFGIKVIADGELFGDVLEPFLNSKVAKIMNKIERQIIKNYRHYKVSTRYQLDSLVSYGFPRNRILFVPISVNIANIPKFPLDDIAPNTFGYFGVLEKWQGVESLVESFEILLKKVPDAHLYIIGNGSLKNTIRDIITNRSLESNIELIHSVPREELWFNYFKKFRFTVIPRPIQNNSIDYNMSIKLVESLAAGKPVITTDLPALQDIKCKSVMIVDYNSPKLLSDAMERMSEIDNKLLRTYYDDAISFAKGFDIRDNIKKITSLLKSDIKD